MGGRVHHAYKRRGGQTRSDTAQGYPVVTRYSSGLLLLETPFLRAHIAYYAAVVSDYAEHADFIMIIIIILYYLRYPSGVNPRCARDEEVLLHRWPAHVSPVRSFYTAYHYCCYEIL